MSNGIWVFDVDHGVPDDKLAAVLNERSKAGWHIVDPIGWFEDTGAGQMLATVVWKRFDAQVT